MQIDLATLYDLAIGTLLVGFGMTLWERHAHPRRRRVLNSWATGYLALALGCVVAIFRSAMPAESGWVLANLIIVAGYLLILDGVARLNGQTYRTSSILVLIVLALSWWIGGMRLRQIFWDHVAAVPIALVSGATAWELVRNRTLVRLRSRPVVAAIAGGHCLFYAVRAFVMPVVAAIYGPDVLPIFGKITMFDGVLYSVAMPMGLLALIREEAQERLIAVSRTDHLTGLGNRHQFFEDGARLLARHGPDTPLSLLAFDLDHFKAINDRFGHATGDMVLKAFARVAREILGPDAILARLGGEEFAALLPGRPIHAAKHLGEKVAQYFSEAAVDGSEPDVRATVSIGVVQRDRDAQDLTELLSAADRALYRAKTLGRNRIEVARPANLVVPDDSRRSARGA
ncbi:GGDEF domain-containing protein [Sphingomonas sp. PR090111-T3T-6A]|uniref:GGDEF domain-containing protein n=1 Tax=Sphingomonas sp. PR090111-T3T-6A TaxID=685778 RepID=UPI0003736C8D|nr:GGDEF domain-containing protein [Sphingomonas sp. PR090111-T3T-6A]